MARTDATRVRRTARSALSAILMAAVASWLGANSASAATIQPVRSGEAVVVDGNDGSRELTHGQSATQFSLRLPAGAACPGDSANDQWRFQSFMVPASAAPDTLHYNVAGPDGPGQFALFQVSTSPLVDVLTNQNAGPGEPGVIPALPPLSFAAFPPDVLAAGTYRIGIACTLSRQTADYWDTEIVITASPSDKPSQFVWRLATAPASVNDSHPGSSAWLLPVGLVVLGAAALAWYLLKRRGLVLMPQRQVTSRPAGRSTAKQVVSRSSGGKSSTTRNSTHTNGAPHSKSSGAPRTDNNVNDNKVTSGSTRGAVTHSKEPQ